MDLVRTVLLYMMMLVNTATGASPSVTPIPASALPTPTPYVTQAPTSIPTAPPTAAPRPTRYNTLYVGDKGSAVRALQNRHQSALLVLVLCYELIKLRKLRPFVIHDGFNTSFYLHERGSQGFNILYHAQKYL